VCLDDVASQKAFAENYSLPFPLLGSSEGARSAAYGLKTRMFGMIVAKRQTFIIGPDGNIAKHYETVNPDEHSAIVLADLKKLLAGS